MTLRRPTDRTPLATDLPTLWLACTLPQKTFTPMHIPASHTCSHLSRACLNHTEDAQTQAQDRVLHGTLLHWLCQESISFSQGR